MQDDEAIQQVAREYVERFGANAAPELRESAERAEAIGDRLSADTWREIGEVAERML